MRVALTKKSILSSDPGDKNKDVIRNIPDRLLPRTILEENTDPPQGLLRYWTTT